MTDAVSGFEASWRARRAAKATANPTDDALYEAYLDAAEGRTAQRNAGRVFDGAPGGAAVDLSEVDGGGDDRLMELYREELSGEAARKRSERDAERHLSGREEKILDDCRRYGHALPRDAEHLRPLLRSHGY